VLEDGDQRVFKLPLDFFKWIEGDWDKDVAEESKNKRAEGARNILYRRAHLPR
jgi:hypothetical protein